MPAPVSLSLVSCPAWQRPAPPPHLILCLGLMRAIWLQLPKHIDEQTILSAVSLSKDVDGFHPLNIGQLTMKVCVGSHRCGPAENTTVHNCTQPDLRWCSHTSVLCQIFGILSQLKPCHTVCVHKSMIGATLAAHCGSGMSFMALEKKKKP